MINNEAVPHKQLEVGKEYYCPYGYKHRGVSGCTIEIVSKSSRKIIYYESGGCQDPYPLEKEAICYELGSAMHESYLLELQINGVINKITRLMDDVPITPTTKEILDYTLAQLTELKYAAKQ